MISFSNRVRLLRGQLRSLRSMGDYFSLAILWKNKITHTPRMTKVRPIKRQVKEKERMVRERKAGEKGNQIEKGALEVRQRNREPER